jgi:hypothetical protein
LRVGHIRKKDKSINRGLIWRVKWGEEERGRALTATGRQPAQLTMLIMHASCNMKRLVVSNGSSSSGWKKFTGHTSMNFTLDDLK